MADHNDNPETYPKLGQLLHRLAVPSGTILLIRILFVACVVVVLLDLTYEKKGYMNPERYFGFYAAYGFVMFTGLIFVAKALRRFIKRPEDYYGDKAIDTEEYPESELSKEVHDG